MTSATHETKSAYASKIDPKTDPKSIVTPFAFEIAPQVLYTPLATPMKRGLAILVDGLLISVLAEQAGLVFILFVGLTLLIQKKSRELGRLFKWGLYLAMLVMMLWVTLGDFLSSTDDDDLNTESDFSTTDMSIKKVGQFIGYVPHIIGFSTCLTLDCAEIELAKLVPALRASALPFSEQASILKNVIEDIDLSNADKASLRQHIAQDLAELDDLNKLALNRQDKNQRNEASVTKEAELLPPQGAEQSGAEEVLTNPLVLQELNLADGMQELHELSQSDELSQLQELDPKSDDEADDYSLISWVMGILNDLGLGFGWAAFYFTVFTAWFDGQTLGKKLFRIRVIQLDGTKLSLWDAFGRYGGYGAGFATGLLGFLQIFWDANRQAIQDKISATVVIDLKRAKITPVSDSQSLIKS
ncbi:RDD family protein [Shewanella violacea]|uniref:RDD domain-containing protein n=1 Tax=Shewanella violacea (strain JCM 10179 / CIP 106290 / LMG 19151 / DSS12) TaxID=637905 RepID=D4ZIX1_SHEVD|nr:RDD family protein [Shewanella violacea]BAJ01620.1 conserved hypothetical protein [Shewanella violacea DSS12]